MEKLKKFLDFSCRFIAGNLLWLAPSVYFSIRLNLLWLLFVPFLVTYVYLSWNHFDQQKAITVQRTSKAIDKLYNVTTAIFFALTCVSTYEGIIAVFGVTSNFYRVFVIFFSVGIVLGLWLITLMIKSRKTPAVIFGLICLYFLFDGLTALPYNFLFFYESVQRADHVSADKRHIDTVYAICNPLFRDREQQARTALNGLENGHEMNSKDDSIKRDRTLKRKQQRLEYLHDQGILSNEDLIIKKANLITNWGPIGYSHTQKDKDSLKNTLGRLQVYKIINQDLADCQVKRSAIDNTFATDGQAELCNQIISKLRVICNHPEEKKLAGVALLLASSKRTSLEAIKDLYRFLGNMHPGQAKITPVNQFNTRDDMLLKSSLASSIVIDILPLLLSILYAKFSRND